MELEAAPIEDFEALVQCAESPGEGEDCVGHLEHTFFAIPEVINKDRVIEAAEDAFTVFEFLRDNAGDIAAIFEAGLCEKAHESRVHTAIDKIIFVLGNHFSKRYGAVFEDGACMAG